MQTDKTIDTLSAHPSGICLGFVPQTAYRRMPLGTKLQYYQYARRFIFVLVIFGFWGFPTLLTAATETRTADILRYGIAGDFVRAQQASEALLAKLLENPPTDDFEAQGSYVASTFFYEYLAKAAKVSSKHNSQSGGVVTFFRAASSARRGENSAALMLMKNAVNDAPGVGALTAFLGRLYIEKCMTTGRDCDTALDLLRTAVQEDPTLAGPHFDAGTVLNHQRRFEEADQAFRAGLQLVSGLRAGWARAQLSIVALQRGRAKLAREEAKKAEQLGVVFPNQFRSAFGLK